MDHMHFGDGIFSVAVASGFHGKDPNDGYVKVLFILLKALYESRDNILCPASKAPVWSLATPGTDWLKMDIQNDKFKRRKESELYKIIHASYLPLLLNP